MKSRKMINLDKAATTSLNRAFLYDIMELAEDYYNPSSANSESVRIRQDIERIRKKVADFLGCRADQIYFVSGASEGNAMVFKGYWNFENGLKAKLVGEHHSIPSFMFSEEIKIDHDGHVDIQDYKRVLDKIEMTLSGALSSYSFVCIGYANSETGALQDIKMLSDIAHEKDVFFMSDITAAAGKIPINVTELGVDAAVLSGHKFHAMKGIGVVYLKNKHSVSPIVYGTQENGMRGGTLNALAIRSLDYAIDNIDFDEYHKKVSGLKDRLIDGLMDIPEVEINSPSSGCLDTVLSIFIDLPVTSQNVVGLFDDEGIIVSAGTACSAYEEEPSETLMAMGFDEERVRRSIRISWDDENTLEEIDEFLNKLKKIIKIFK